MLGLEPLRQQLARYARGRTVAGCPPLSYLFVARFADGHLIGQTAEDKGLLPDPKRGGACGSAFTDVELYDQTMARLTEFYLFGEGSQYNVHGVDLRDGTLVLYGERRPLNPVQMAAVWGCLRPARFTVLYQRQVDQRREIGNKTGQEFSKETVISGYAVGWETEVGGKPYSAVITLGRQPDGSYLAHGPGER